MNQQIQGANALSPGDLPLKRKRGRPRKDESLVKGESVQAVAGSESVKKSRLSLDSGDGVDKMVGQVVSGVIEGSFDDGYLLNVKIGDTDTELRGVVFLPGHFTPVNPTNDVAPLVPMYKRKEMPIPTPNPHPQPSGSAQPENSNKQSTEAKDQVPALTDQSQPSQSLPDVFVALKDKSLIDIVPQVDCIPKDNTDLSLSGTFVAPPSNEPGLDSRTSDVTAPMECDKAVYTLFKIEASKLMKEPNEVVTNRSSEAEQPSPEPVSERRPDIEISTVVKGPNEVDTKRSSEVEPSLAPVSEILPLTETSILVKGLDSVKENKESKEEHTPPPAIISQGIEVVGEKSKVQDQVLSSSTRKSLLQGEMKIPNFELNQPPPTVLSKFELTTFETENKSVNNGYGEGVVEGIESSPTRNQIQPEMMLEGETIPKISSEKKMFF